LGRRPRGSGGDVFLLHPPSAERKPVSKSKWILVAEDDAVIAELTVLTLAAEELPCELIVAGDGVEALDCLRCRGVFQLRGSGNPVAVLLDLRMPKLDGFEVLRQIRSDPELKYIPVVMFTSSDDAEDIRRSYELGANAYLVKPIGVRNFKAALGSFGRFWVNWNRVVPYREAKPVEVRQPVSPVVFAGLLPEPGIAVSRVPFPGRRTKRI
jgi:two-component system, response regulator